jgi:hypothetical protein
MFEYERFANDRSSAAGEQQLGNRRDQMDGEYDQITHPAMLMIRDRGARLGSLLCLCDKFEFATHTLRETPLDLFGWTAERKLERRLRDAYLKSMRKQCETLSADNLAAATDLPLAPPDVRGFGPVKTPAAEALMSRLI